MGGHGPFPRNWEAPLAPDVSVRRPASSASSRVARYSGYPYAHQRRSKRCRVADCCCWPVCARCLSRSDPLREAQREIRSAGRRHNASRRAPNAALRVGRTHYKFLLKQANGGTKHTVNTLPDWSGIWQSGITTMSMRHPVDAPLSPAYRASYDEKQRQEREDGEVYTTASRTASRRRTPDGSSSRTTRSSRSA